MNTDTNEPNPAPPSALFPDVNAEERALAVQIAEQYTANGFDCSADDVLLGDTLSAFGEHIMATGDKSLNTNAMRRLFDAKSPIGGRARIGLAKTLRRVYAGEPVSVSAAALDLTQILAAVLVSVAPDKRGVKPLGG